MVLFDNTGTARRLVECCFSALLRALVKRDASLRFQNRTITFDNEVSEGGHGRVCPLSAYVCVSCQMSSFLYTSCSAVI